METISFVLSAAGLLSFIIANFIKGRRMGLILALNALGNLLMAASYISVSNANGALSSIVGTVTGIINYFFAIREKKVPVWLLFVYAAAFACVNLMVFSRWVDLVALIASLTAVMVISAANGKQYRAWALGNNCLWCLFDILRGNFGPLISHLSLAGFTFAGMLIHDIRKPIKKQ